MRAWVMVLALAPLLARAGSLPELLSRAQLPEGQVAGEVGWTMAGASVLLPRNSKPSALALEATYNWANRFIDLQGGWARQWLDGGAWRASTTLGATLTLVPTSPLDVGIGTAGGAYLGLGGRTFGGYLGAEFGVEGFVRDFGPRLPLRGVLGLQGSAGPIFLAASARGGLDFEPGQVTVWRGEVRLTVGWILESGHRAVEAPGS